MFATATLAPLEPPTLTVQLVNPAEPYAPGTPQIPLPACQRYVDDFKELAAAVRGEKALTASLDEAWLVAAAPGYETLAPDAPSREELARFFAEQRDRFERSEAARAFRNGLRQKGAGISSGEAEL